MTNEERLTQAVGMIAAAKQRGAEEMLHLIKAMAHGTRDQLDIVNNFSAYVEGIEHGDRDVYLISTGYNLGMERLCEVAEEALPVIFNEEQNHAAMVDDIFARIKKAKQG